MTDIEKNLLYELRIMASYHGKRTAFFDGLEDLTRVAIIVGAILTVILASSNLHAGLGFLVGVLLLLFAPIFISRSAAVHASLRSRHRDLSCRLTADDLLDTEAHEALLRTCVRVYREISMDEPGPPKQVLLAVCVNEHVIGTGEGTSVKLSFLQKFLAPVTDVGDVPSFTVSL